MVDAALAVGTPVAEEDAATLVLADPELWPHPVDGAGLLDGEIPRPAIEIAIKWINLIWFNLI